MAGRLKIYNANTSAWEYTSADFANNVNQIFNEVPTGLVNGSNQSYTTASTYVSGSLNVFKNGIRLKGAGNDYTETAGGFTMVSAPATGTVLLVDYNIATGIYSTGINTFEPLQIPAGLVNSSNTTYTCAKSYIGSTLQVYINGILQAPTTHYTETSPQAGTFTMGDAPITGDNILVSYQHEFAASGDADTVDGIHASSLAMADGWQLSIPTWTYVSASTFTVAGDYTTTYTKGTRLKWTQTTVKYGVVVDSSYSSPNTTVTIAVNNDYTIANATISNNYYSYSSNPQGYPGWFAYTPLVNGTGGSAGTYAATNYGTRYKIDGTGCSIKISIDISNKGSWSGNVQCSAPVIPAGGAGTEFVYLAGFCTNIGDTVMKGLPSLNRTSTTIGFGKGIGATDLLWSDVTATFRITVSGTYEI